jgi:DNA-3-methyladenine glycosylase II
MTAFPPAMPGCIPVTAGLAALVRHDREMRRYDTVMTDHPAWTPVAGPWATRVMPAPDGSHALVRTDGIRAEWCCPQAEAREPGIFTLPEGTAPELAAPLGTLGPVARFANPSLWDAIATAVIRQVVRADQARAQYRALCAAHGTEVRCGALAGWLLPSPEAVLVLDDAQFKSLGLTFKREALRGAAQAFLKDGDAWASLPPLDLAAVLPSVRRIGPWTAGAATADWSNDFSVYPYGDLAVRTWATRVTPDAEWPDDEASFCIRWKRVTSPNLADITLLTLAWGGHHARTST